MELTPRGQPCCFVKILWECVILIDICHFNGTKLIKSSKMGLSEFHGNLPTHHVTEGSKAMGWDSTQGNNVTSFLDIQIDICRGIRLSSIKLRRVGKCLQSSLRPFVQSFVRLQFLCQKIITWNSATCTHYKYAPLRNEVRTEERGIREVWLRELMQQSINMIKWGCFKQNIPVCSAPGQKYLHDTNMHNSDTVWDKGGGQEHLCCVCIPIKSWCKLCFSLKKKEK